MDPVTLAMLLAVAGIMCILGGIISKNIFILFLGVALLIITFVAAAFPLGKVLLFMGLAGAAILALMFIVKI